MKQPGVSMTLLIILLSATWVGSHAFPFTGVVVVPERVELVVVFAVAVAVWVMTSVPLRAAVRCVDWRMMLNVKGGMVVVCESKKSIRVQTASSSST
jgi:hypothetical protein